MAGRTGKLRWWHWVFVFVFGVVLLSSIVLWFLFALRVALICSVGILVFVLIVRFLVPKKYREVAYGWVGEAAIRLFGLS
jgi:hypothetical protein